MRIEVDRHKLKNICIKCNLISEAIEEIKKDLMEIKMIDKGLEDA